MYIFTFNRHYNFDKVCYLETNKKFLAGDLIGLNNEYALCLGKNIPFKEIYSNYIQKDSNWKLAQSRLLSKNCIDIINHIVWNYFASYKRVVSLYLPYNNIDKFFKHKSNTQKNILNHLKYDNWYIKEITGESNWQQLIVFPDIWTAYNFVENLQNFSKYKLYDGNTTIVAKSKLFWEIKQSKSNIVICTYSQIFLNWQKLRHIIVFWPHTWYYKNYQEPRYCVINVLKKMADIHKAKLEFIQDYRFLQVQWN